MEASRLNLGCGSKILPGFINIDLPSNHSGSKPDIESSLFSLPFPDDYAEEAMAIHVLEHFYPWEAGAVLKEWIRVLKPGATLALELPCFEKIIALATDPKSMKSEQVMMRFVWWGLYGDPNWEDPRMMHRWCYSRPMLANLMASVGLRDIKEEPVRYHRPERDMRFVGVK